jgi:hypothetical protein
VAQAAHSARRDPVSSKRSQAGTISTALTKAPKCEALDSSSTKGSCPDSASQASSTS